MCISQLSLTVGRVDILVATKWAKELTPYITTMPFSTISLNFFLRAHPSEKVGSLGYAGLPAAKNGSIGLAD